jgi:hypothetical protein
MSSVLLRCNVWKPLTPLTEGHEQPRGERGSCARQRLEELVVRQGRTQTGDLVIEAFDGGAHGAKLGQQAKTAASLSRNHAKIWGKYAFSARAYSAPVGSSYARSAHSRMATGRCSSTERSRFCAPAATRHTSCSRSAVSLAASAVSLAASAVSLAALAALTVSAATRSYSPTAERAAKTTCSERAVRELPEKSP